MPATPLEKNKKKLYFCLKCNFNSYKMVILTRFLKTGKSRNFLLNLLCSTRILQKNQNLFERERNGMEWVRVLKCQKCKA